MPRILYPLRPFWGVSDVSSMSDSEHSTVTYTSVSEDDSDIGSPGVDGPPIMPEVPPSPDYIPGPEGPPSPDYWTMSIPGEEQPMHAADHLLLSHRIPSLPLPISLPPPNGPTYAEGSLGSRATGIKTERCTTYLLFMMTELLIFVYASVKRPCVQLPGSWNTWSGRVRQLWAIQEIAPYHPRGGQIESTELTTMLDHGGCDHIFCWMMHVMPSSTESQNYSYRLGTVDGWLAIIVTHATSRPPLPAPALSLQTTVMAQQSEITELQAADHRRQAVIIDLLKADYQRQRQARATRGASEIDRERLRLVMIVATVQKWHKRKAHEVKPRYNSPTSRRTLNTTTCVTCAPHLGHDDEGCFTAVLASTCTTRNGDDSHTSRTGVRRNEHTVRECTYQDFMKCQPLFFRGTEGVVDLTQLFERMETVFRISNYIVENQVKFATCTLMGIALTWWNSHARTVTNEVAYAMTWSDLKKKMTTKYCPWNESPTRTKGSSTRIVEPKSKRHRCGSLQPTFPGASIAV
ncbi:hypothetical protein Tco_0569570 [Tanacetum coccineum]